MMFSQFDYECMSQALRLAARGMNTTRPNPRVGCVLANNNEVISSGWHKRCGEAHAEVFALEAAGERARGASCYVTLEPCSHQGRTPSCAKALIKAGIGRVVSAIADDNPQVCGSGFSLLEQAGIQVESGLMREQAEHLNAGFIMRMRHDRPWVRIKLAQSMDGKTALADGASEWISGEASRNDVQVWRARSCAIMTGIGTILADNPSLNVRQGSVDLQPMRVIVDSQWRTPASARTLQLPGRVLIVGRDDVEIPSHLADSTAELLRLPAADKTGGICLQSLMKELSNREINELQVEAGGILAGALLEQQLVDEILLYQAPILLGTSALESFRFGPLGTMEQRMTMQCLETRHIGPDLRYRLKPVYAST